MLYEINNFDLDSPLVCEGVIGDGCGGGRIFTIEDNMLKAYDPQSKELIVLLEKIYMPKSISKKGCILFIECENEEFEFDLSIMSRVNKL